MRRQVTIFGCRVDALTMLEAVEAVGHWIERADGRCRYVVTPNVHHTVMYQWHEGLRAAYASAGLVLADGMPLVWASRLLRRPLPQRVAGSDLVPAVFDRFRDRGLRVYLLGAAEGVGRRAAANIERRWPGIRVTGVFSPPLGFEREAAKNEEILARMAAAGAELLVVGLGAPKQELWVHAHQSRIAAPVALCVGATIDFLADHKPRAPRWMRESGLEWLHRLASEPRRLFGRYAHDAWFFTLLLVRELFRPGHPAAALPDAVAPPEARSLSAANAIAPAGAAQEGLSWETVQSSPSR